MPHSRESTRKFLLEFHIEFHSAESQIKLFFKNENRLRAMPHTAEFFRIAGSRTKILSAFTEAVKVKKSVIGDPAYPMAVK
jgi:hypothetical protein